MARIPTPLGDFVRDRRKSLALTLDTAAARSGLSRSYINFLERGTRGNPSVEVLEQLARGLRVPVEVLDRLARGLPASPQLSRTAEVNQMADRLSKLPPSTQVEMLTVIDLLLAQKEAAAIAETLGD